LAQAVLALDPAVAKQSSSAMRPFRVALLGAGLIGALVRGQDEEEGDLAPEEGDVNPEDEVLTEEKLTALFKRMDKNSDGQLLSSELQAFAKDMALKSVDDFASEALASDADGDEKLSLDEFYDHEGADDKGRKKIAKLKFDAADKDGDGFLNGREASLVMIMDADEAVEEAHAVGEIKNLDKNGDGKLNVDEFTTGGGDDNLVGEEHEFPELDKNGDGSLDVKELQAYFSGRHFTEKALFQFIDDADTDKNGHVTLEEVLAKREHLLGHESEASYHLSGWIHDLEL